jgi:hypothetical protein
VVMLRNATDGDAPAVRELTRACIVYAGDGLWVPDQMLDAGLPPVDGLRVAEDALGLVGTYSLLARRGAAGGEAELTIMLVAQRAKNWGVNRLLVSDARHQAALRGAHEVAIMARPPMDVFFRDLGSRTIGIAVPCGRITWPRLHMELPL